MPLWNHAFGGSGRKPNDQPGSQHQFFAYLGLALHPKMRFPLGLHYLNFHVTIVLVRCYLKSRGMVEVEYRYRILRGILAFGAGLEFWFLG